MAQINKIIIHCAATANGVRLARGGKTAAQIIDGWHEKRLFHRNTNDVIRFNRALKYIGYHFVIDTDGTLETGRAVGERGAHCKGQNTGSVGICLVGTDRFTAKQWAALKQLVDKLKHTYPNATLHGHREFSPKICPGFDVKNWVEDGFIPHVNHTIMEYAE
ncbi:N-acetylmuramoyl-L-alanine amidase [Pasteurellaceae bacterium HPA106]|uniref:N-acetylmuramoyl-L-alanine amidase n=1 Tax=Spirabiliibacterium pneumoniae TaxID=221400 RepID=UPI001AAD4663|nr:N-acetylmuramoyl-L-alanine amidase [Spirabiliibacterium pneumoniae]MBE2895473.1 N-acetylmuramoyl-L-alanine amidase [Spirabiliibacterium pneumoniae]